MLASTASWNVQTPDPSTELAPYTAQRLREVTAPTFSPKPRLLAPLKVQRVERAEGGGFNVVAVWKAAEALQLTSLRKPMGGTAEEGPEGWPTVHGVEGAELVLHTPQPPVLCTGFEGSVKASARHLFDLADESDEAKGCLAGAPMLSTQDESTKVPGVFLVGPSVRHGQLELAPTPGCGAMLGTRCSSHCRPRLWRHAWHTLLLTLPATLACSGPPRRALLLLHLQVPPALRHRRQRHLRRPRP